MIDYKKYKVWQKSHALVLNIYNLTSSFPDLEKFNLVTKINRAATSIPTKIAEGCGRETQKELLRFLYISSGSAHELEYLIILSRDLNYLQSNSAEAILSDIIEIKKMLASLIRKIKSTL